MVLIDDYPGGSFYIDVYEGSVSALGDWGAQDQDRDKDGKLADAAMASAHAASHGWVWDDDGGEGARRRRRLGSLGRRSFQPGKRESVDSLPLCRPLDRVRTSETGGARAFCKRSVTLSNLPLANR